MNKKFLNRFSIFCALLIILAIMFSCSLDLENSSSDSGSINEVGKVSYYIPTTTGEWKFISSKTTKGNALLSFPNAPSIYGKVFYGWYDSEDFTNEIIESSFLTTEISKEIKIYAKYIDESDAKNPTITFKTNGGSIIAPTTINFRSTLPAVSTSRKDGSFVGWYFDEDLQQPLDIQYYRFKEDTTLYARWRIDGSELYWELNGGESSAYLQDTYSSSYKIALPDPSKLSKEGYELDAWYTDADLTQLYSGDSSDYSGVLTLYAKWKGKNYNITYHVNDSEYDFNESEYPSLFIYGSTLSISGPSPIDKRYVFDGWYLDFDLKEALDVTNLPAHDIDLYPSRKLEVETVTWNLNGGVCSEDLQDEYSSKYPLSLPSDSSLTKTGYDFAGWYTNSSLTNAYSGNSSDYSGPLSLYAKWSGKTYNITYHVDTTMFVFDDTSYPKSFVYGEELSIADLETKDSSYVFAGWYLDELYETKLDLNNLPINDIDLYSKYRINCDEIPNQETIVYSSSLSNHLGIKFDSSLQVNSASIDSQYYLMDTASSESWLILKKSYLASISEGKREKVTFNVLDTSDDSTYEISYYLVPVSTTSYEFSKLLTYEKSTKTDLTITSSTTVSSSSIYCVIIDNKEFNYTYSSNSIVIDQSDIYKLKVGRHIYEIYTDLGISSGIIDITCVSQYAPYNVKIDIDSFYPTFLVTWDCDFIPDSYNVTIGSNVYTSTAYPSKFNGNTFDATGLISQKGTSVKVTAIKNTFEYESIEDLMPLTIEDGADTILSYENGYTFGGQTSNWYLTTYDELYDALFYIMLFWEDFANKTTINSLQYSYVYYCIDEEVLSDSRIDYTNSLFTSFAEDEITTSNPSFLKILYKYVFTTLPEAERYSQGIGTPSSTEFQSSNDNDYIFYYYAEGGKVPNENNETTIRRQDEVGSYAQIKFQNTHYGSGFPEDYVFPIEINNKGNANVKSSIELYVALEKGYNPVIDSSYASLSSMYENMKQILRTILDEDMNEFEIATAIYEYLELNVIYDHALVDAGLSYSTDNNYYVYTSYYMEGVFNYGAAVCNAIAPAYASLLNMMGIKAHKLSGTANGGGHAWVELQIGGLWYIADPTWGNCAVKISDIGYEMINYNYCLIPYQTSVSQGRSFTWPEVYGEHYSGDESLDIFKLLTFTYNTVEYDYYIDSVLEAQAAANYMINKFKSSMSSGEYMAIQLQFASTTYYTSFLGAVSGYSVSSAALANNVYCLLLKKS